LFNEPWKGTSIAVFEPKAASLWDENVDAAGRGSFRIIPGDGDASSFRGSECACADATAKAAQTSKNDLALHDGIRPTMKGLTQKFLVSNLRIRTS